MEATASRFIRPTFTLNSRASNFRIPDYTSGIPGKQIKVIGYGSRALTPAEKKYYSAKLEILVVKWAACNHLWNYLYCASHFKIYTYNNPAIYITTTGRLSATGQRWVNELAKFNFWIHHGPGKQNVIADTLSRPSTNTYAECMEAYTKLISSGQVKAILDAAES